MLWCSMSGLVISSCALFLISARSSCKGDLHSSGFAGCWLTSCIHCCQQGTVRLWAIFGACALYLLGRHSNMYSISP